MKICLAASGGGHVRQLLDLQEVWRDYDHFFVTEPTALGQSIAQDHQTFFVSHVAWGQAKLGAPFRMVASGVLNMWQSLKIAFGNRPDVILTTGAGSMAFTVMFGRLIGAKVVLIDSFARFDGPSLFAKLAGPMAHERIAQAPKSAQVWAGAKLFDPFRVLDEQRPAKSALAFATVGATLPFPRLVDWVETAKNEGLLPGQVIAQVGEGGRHFGGVKCHDTLPFGEVKDILQRADIVICHGGTGSIITALKAGCHVIAIPRLFAAGEHYDDHQLEVTNALEQRGLLQVATTIEEFRQALRNCAEREPIVATSDPSALRGWLSEWLNQQRR